MASPETITTDIDKFLFLVREKKSLTISAASSALKEAEETCEKWALILDKKGLLKLVYPENPFEKPIVKAILPADPKEGKPQKK